MVERVLFAPGGATEVKQDAVLTALGGVFDVADTGERQYPTKNVYVTAGGDTTVLTPTAGKAIRVHKTQAVNRPTATTAPLIGLRFGANPEWWSNFVIMTRQLFTGAVDEPLIVNLDGPGQVAVTVLYEEI